jgi:hypothetical protein
MSNQHRPLRIPGQVIPDPVDLRDLIYRPSLELLPDQFLCAAIDPRSGALSKLLNVRNQNEKPTCIGEALAALIDIQRIEAYGKRADVSTIERDVQPASAAMLHAMAIEIEQTERGGPAMDIRNLRSGLKGFFNTGVCTEATWKAARGTRQGGSDGPRHGFDTVTVDVMREARNVTLGAYYRVRSAINDYHSAIMEAGALYVAAEIHGGWTEPPGGIIAPDNGGPSPADGHAFVIVGYTRDGFLVLNSWGSAWGHYNLPGAGPLPGVALWRYEDWAGSVLDCWVLRLAASTPDSFRFAVRAQGLTNFAGGLAAAAVPSVRRLEVLGRYLHMADGAFAAGGSYPSSRRSFRTTLAHLARPGPTGGAKDFDAIRLTLHGDTSSTESIMARLLAGIPDDKKQRVHGISVDWVNGLLDGAAMALQPLFDAALKITRGNRDDADTRIERMTRPVGRALWRDVKRAARRGGRAGGDAAFAVSALTTLCAQSGKPLHIVVEGAGVLLLTEVLAAVMRSRDEAKRLCAALSSLTLVAPLCTHHDYAHGLGPFLAMWRERTGRRAVLFKASVDFDERLSVGAYSRSWTDLVSNAFEEQPVKLVSSPGFVGELAGEPDIRELHPPRTHAGDLDASHLLRHETIAAHLRDETARGFSGPTQKLPEQAANVRRRKVK